MASAESRASAQRLDELRATFVQISSLEPRKRGYALEELLRDLFDAFELDPKASFKVVGEQIDGGFTLDTQHYIVEAKWEAGPADRADLDVLAAKVERRADNTLGLLIAYAGFQPTAIELHSARRSTLMLVDGADLYAVLEGRIDLRELLRRKRRHASMTGAIVFKHEGRKHPGDEGRGGHEPHGRGARHKAPGEAEHPYTAGPAIVLVGAVGVGWPEWYRQFRHRHER